MKSTITLNRDDHDKAVISFYTDENCILRLCESGKIYYLDEQVGDNKIIVTGLDNWLTNAQKQHNKNKLLQIGMYVLFLISGFIAGLIFYRGF